jgi:hypothetical protein
MPSIIVFCCSVRVTSASVSQRSIKSVVDASHSQQSFQYSSFQSNFLLRPPSINIQPSTSTNQPCSHITSCCRSSKPWIGKILIYFLPHPVLHSIINYFTFFRDRSGRISANELQQALSNGSWRPFNPETCRVMVNMFDKDNDGGIGFHEFQALWNVSQHWAGVK